MPVVTVVAQDYNVIRLNRQGTEIGSTHTSNATISTIIHRSIVRINATAAYVFCYFFTPSTIAFHG